LNIFSNDSLLVNTSILNPLNTSFEFENLTIAYNSSEQNVEIPSLAG